MNCPQTKSDIVVVSPSNLDILATGKFSWPSTESIPASLKSMPGGSGRNTAENLARLGVSTTLLTITGDDVFGEFVCQKTLQAGVNVVVTKNPSVSTPIYLALHNSSDGDMMLDMVGGTECCGCFNQQFGQENIHYLQDSQYIITASDICPDLFFFLAEEKKDSALVLLISSPYAAKEAAPLIEKTDILFLNKQEAKIITKAEIQDLKSVSEVAHSLLQMGPSIVVLTLSGDGVYLASKDGESCHYPAFKMEGEMVSPVGAGDAMCAGFVYGLLQNYSLEKSILMGSATAALTIRSMETVVSSLQQDSLERIVSNFQN